MNNRQQATEKIIDFIKSENKILLLTGTYQYEKHKLVLQQIARSVLSPSSILFRANGMDNVSSFLGKSTTRFQTGTPYKLGNHKLFIDTINVGSWKRTYDEYDFAILYPIDSVLKMKNKEAILDDLCIHRHIGKIFIVSWTDHESDDYSWLDKYQLNDRVIFDAEEENPKYHARVLEHW